MEIEAIAWRQEKHLYFLLVLLQSGRSKLAMTDLQIVQNEKQFLLCTADQTLLIHGVLTDHKADMPDC